MASPATVEEYLDTLRPEVRDVVQSMRDAVLAAVPDATERISYGIPTFDVDGRALVHVAGWKAHVSVYPLPDLDTPVGVEVAPYVAGRGTAKFPLDRPIPYDLIGRIAAALLESRTP